jgi:hypothetical protein
MGSISTNDTHLPIQIVTAGDSKDMTISLTKTNLESNISILDSIEVHPIKYASEVVFGKYLHYNTLDYGKYNVFYRYYEFDVGVLQIIIFGRYLIFI